MGMGSKFYCSISLAKSLNYCENIFNDTKLWGIINLIRSFNLTDMDPDTRES